jgi:hypothetical protein
MTQLSAAPSPASALTVLLKASNFGGWSLAAAVRPVTSSTGAAADDAVPHHGTSRTSGTPDTSRALRKAATPLLTYN